MTHCIPMNPRALAAVPIALVACLVITAAASATSVTCLPEGFPATITPPSVGKNVRDQYRVDVWRVTCEDGSGQVALLMRVTPFVPRARVCSSSFRALQGRRDFAMDIRQVADSFSPFCSDVLGPTTFALDQSSAIPPDRLYTKGDEWAKIEGDRARLGISAVLANAADNLVFIELPQLGATVTQHKSYAVVEGVNFVTDLFAPLSGTVVEVNTDLRVAPNLLKQDPYGAGTVVIVPANAAEQLDLLSSAQYEAFIGPSRPLTLDKKAAFTLGIDNSTTLDVADAGPIFGVTIVADGCVNPCRAGQFAQFHLHVTNPGAPIATELKTAVRLPNGNTFTLLGRHLEVTLNSGVSDIPLISLVIPASSAQGTYVIESAVVFPDTGVTFSRSHLNVAVQ